MMTDELLERGLGDIADQYDVPAHAIDDILDQLRPAVAVEDEAVAPAHRRWPPARKTWLLSSAAAVLVLVVVAFAAGGGGGSQSGGPKVRADFGGKGVTGTGATQNGPGQSVVTQPQTALGRLTAGAPSAAAPVPARAQTQAGQQKALGGAPTSTVPGDSLTKIVQTGELALQVDKIKVADAVTKLTAYASGAGGLVADSQTTEGGSDPSASVTLRVPNRSFGTVLGQARALGKVQSEQTKTADVTAQYVDLQARIHALKETRATYLRILSHASGIGDILSVQQQIDDTQTQIEQLQGQLKVLTDQTTYATLTVSIDQKPKVAPAAVVHHESGFSKAVHRSVSRFVHGVEAIIGAIGPIVLVLLLLAFGWLFAKVGYRIVRRQLV
jgi:hypothetical protein